VYHSLNEPLSRHFQIQPNMQGNVTHACPRPRQCSFHAMRREIAQKGSLTPPFQRRPPSATLLRIFKVSKWVVKTASSGCIKAGDTIISFAISVQIPPNHRRVSLSPSLPLSLSLSISLSRRKKKKGHHGPTTHALLLVSRCRSGNM
jgi:hypothetical protein